MAATPPTIAPVAPSPTSAPVPAAAPPPPAPPPLSTLTEKASQLAGQISSQPQFEAALASVGGGTLDFLNLSQTNNNTQVAVNVVEAVKVTGNGIDRDGQGRRRGATKKS